MAVKSIQSVVARFWGAVVIALVVGGLVSTAGPAGAQGAVIVRPGQSIQDAVDAASPGTTIIVRPGVYAEHVTITTDGIRLIGQRGASVVPPAQHPQSACSFGGESTDGICAIGELDFPDPEGLPVVTDPISDVTIKGFTVKGFEGVGILFIGAENPVIAHNRTDDNEEYGIARFISTGGKIVNNRASGSEEAGIYVGDSPNADVHIAANETSDNLFGFFLRDAANGHVVGNRSHGNCVGALVLNTGANVAGDWTFNGNRISRNNAFCPANEEEGTPPLSGLGIVIASGADNTLKGNHITGNVPSGEVPFAGGVAVLESGDSGANPPSGNLVQGNVIRGNQPDIFWDGSGNGNVFRANNCDTSVPDGLC